MEEKIKDAFETLTPDDATVARMKQRLEGRVEEAEKKQARTPFRRWLPAVATVCSLALVLVVVVSVIPNLSHDNDGGIGNITPTPAFTLSKSTGDISIAAGDPEIASSTNADMMWLSEEELFSYFETEIVEAEVSGIQNIKIDLDGDVLYRAVATLTLKKVYRGEYAAQCLANDKTVSILLPCPINNITQIVYSGEEAQATPAPGEDGQTATWVEDTGVISNLQIGMQGIFMLMPYTEESRLEMNHCTLILSEVAEYGMPDGERYAFLRSNDGIIYSEYAYQSLSGVQTLEEIATYIEAMIQ